MNSYFQLNLLGRDFALGDLHGQYKRLMTMLVNLKFDFSKDRLFSLGDFIDRGPSSQECLELLNEPWFYSVKGNHEDLLVKTFEDESMRPVWNANGGAWANNIGRDALAKYKTMLCNLPLVIIIGTGKDRVNLIHAEFFGTDKKLDAGNYPPIIFQQLLWGRRLINEPAKYRHLSLMSRTFCGHSVVKSPLKIGSQIYLDTGAGFIEKGGKLTICNITENRFYSI